MKLSLCFLILTLLAACGKAPKTKPNQVVTQENFMSMSHEEIMRVKYDNEIDLVCELRVQDGPYLDLNYKPSKKLIWKLNQELSKSKEIEFEFKGRHYSVEVSRLSSQIKLQHLDYRDSEGNRFIMDYSPTLEIRYRSRMSFTESPDFYQAKDFIGQASVYENVPTVIYTITSENMETRETVSEDLRCTLSTKINKGYEDQWLRK